MKIAKYLLSCILLSSSCLLFAEESPLELTQGFISDDLFVYMHSGAGNNFRILGTINAGTEIQLTGLSENSYTQFIDTKGNKAWVESTYISTTPGLRFVIADLNSKLADAADETAQRDQLLVRANSTIAELTEQVAQLQLTTTNLQTSLTKSNNLIKNQDSDLKKEWFFNGAIVLTFGLILGLILPRLAGRRKSSMNNWK